MNKKKFLDLNTVKVIALCVVVFCMAVAGYLFREHRTFKEAVVVSEHVTEVKKLSDYSDVIKAPSTTATSTSSTAACPAATS